MAGSHAIGWDPSSPRLLHRANQNIAVPARTSRLRRADWRTTIAGVDVAHRDQILAFRLASHNLTRRLGARSMVKAAAPCGIQETPLGSAALWLFWPGSRG